MKSVHFKAGELGEDKRTSIDTETDYPGSVFLHINNGGFGYCELMTPEQARRIAQGFWDAADKAEMQTTFA